MAPQTTYYATATIDGEAITKTRTSANPYTHAAFHASVNPEIPGYFATWHRSAALADKSGKNTANGPNVAVVEVTTTAPDVAAVEPVSQNSSETEDVAPVETTPAAPQATEPESQNSSETAPEGPAYETRRGNLIHLTLCPKAKRTRVVTRADFWEAASGMYEISQDQAHVLLANPRYALCDACAKLTGVSRAWQVKASGIVHTTRCKSVVKYVHKALRPISDAEAVALLAENPKKHCKECTKVASQNAGGSETAPTKAVSAPVESKSQNIVSSETASPAPERKTNKASTKAVIHNLTGWYETDMVKGSINTDEAWTHMVSTSVEDFRDHSIRYLGQHSNLRMVTLESADWTEVYATFYPAELETADHAVVAPEPTAAPVSVDDVVTLADAELGGNLVQAVLALAALAEQGRTVRIESGLLAGHESALLDLAPALAQFHRERTGERVSAGLAAAKAQGRRTGGRPKAVDADTAAALASRVESGESVTDAAKALGISRATAYRALSPGK